MAEQTEHILQLAALIGFVCLCLIAAAAIREEFRRHERLVKRLRRLRATDEEAKELVEASQETP